MVDFREDEYDDEEQVPITQNPFLNDTRVDGNRWPRQHDGIIYLLYRGHQLLLQYYCSVVGMMAPAVVSAPHPRSIRSGYKYLPIVPRPCL